MDELAQDAERIMAGEKPAQGSANQVTEPPQGFKQWVEDNQQRITTAKSLPYFIKDNRSWVNGMLHPQAQQADNLSELAAKIGIVKGKPMAHEEADFGLGNPHYSGKYNDPYSINCQSCVVAYEARRRGLDVAAMPNYGLEETATRKLSENLSLAWIDPLTGKHPEAVKAASPRLVGSKIVPATYAQIVRGFKEATREEGRYFVGLAWKRGGSNGHIFCVERLAGGKLRSFDPQSGEAHVLNDYLKKASGSRSIQILRVDNLDFDADFTSKVLTKQSTKRFAGVAEARTAKGGVLGAPAKGKLTTDPGRIEQANKSKQEQAKFEKEQRMCKVLTDNGHDVHHRDDRNGGYDVEIDGIPYDLKSLSSANNIVKNASHAVRDQGAKGVIFEFTEMTEQHHKELGKLTQKGIHGFYYVKGDYQMHDF